MNTTKQKILNMTYTAIFAVIIAVCSWISIPSMIPFTLQTFAIFLCLYVLGGKMASICVFTYLMLGFIGIPVFSSFRSGPGVILGATGGYLIGFIFLALAYWLITKFFGERFIVVVLAMLIGTVVCYAFGTAWFVIIYTNTSQPVGVIAALTICVFPFIIPDMIKLALALIIGVKLKKIIKL